MIPLTFIYGVGKCRPVCWLVEGNKNIALPFSGVRKKGTNAWCDSAFLVFNYPVNLVIVWNKISLASLFCRQSRISSALLPYSLPPTPSRLLEASWDGEESIIIEMRGRGEVPRCRERQSCFYGMRRSVPYLDGSITAGADQSASIIPYISDL